MKVEKLGKLYAKQTFRAIYSHYYKLAANSNPSNWKIKYNDITKLQIKYTTHTTNTLQVNKCITFQWGELISRKEMTAYELEDANFVEVLRHPFRAVNYAYILQNTNLCSEERF